MIGEKIQHAKGDECKDEQDQQPGFMLFHHALNQNHHNAHANTENDADEAGE